MLSNRLRSLRDLGHDFVAEFGFDGSNVGVDKGFDSAIKSLPRSDMGKSSVEKVVIGHP